MRRTISLTKMRSQKRVPNAQSRPLLSVRGTLPKKPRLLQQSLHYLLHIPQPVAAEVGQLGVNEDIELEGEVLAQKI